MNRSDRNRLSGIFALSLTLSIIFGVYQPIYSQSPSPREALIEEIREDVARQLAIDKPALEDADIEKRYLEKAEAVGITRRKLIALYEQEYFDQKQAQQSSPWQKFIPNVGWLVGLVSMAALACTTVLQSWINAQIAAINSWLYGKFLGITLFRNVVSKKYRAALKQNYEQLPMPFLKNRNHLKMEDVYIPLNISDGEQEEHKNDLENTTSPETIDAYVAIAKHKRLIVTGEPGSGKSVLLKYLAWSYGSDKLNGLANRPIVILLELYRLSDVSLDEAKLLEELVKTFDINQFPNAQQFVLQGLKNGLFLLLFDGLDEVNSDVRGHVSSVIRDFLKKYEQCRVVITCRNTVYNEEFSGIVERKLEVAEFTNRQIRQFLKFWEPEMRQAGKSIKQMMEDIEERPLILRLAHNPLLLTLIAYLYTESDFVLPHSRAELYQKSASILLEKRQYKSYDDYKYKYQADDKRRILERLALYIQNSSSNKDLRSVTVGAAREEAKTTLIDVGLSQEQAREILDEIVERSGLFIKGKDKISGEEYYIFSHSTIQEYFAAAALKEQEAELIQQYEANPTAWQEVIKLWCSLANESTNVVRTVYKQDALMGFECLAEARQINPTLVNQIIDYFKPKLNELQPNDTLVQTFGTVAASKDDPGIAVFDFLALKLYERNASDVFRNAVASALSRTNLPEAAKHLVNEWKGRREPIVRMGDLAVPALKKQAHKANLRAQDDLYRIRTPDAIDALVSLLWHEEGFIANRAAQFLGRLLFREDIKEILRNYEFNGTDLKVHKVEKGCKA
ncbi:putative NTPase (NACHT family) [Leptolyngbya sp. PCC 7375]|nr:putative NTPase (NACHT family) [Leptolyngbya sp. PCC 7375]